MVTSLELLTPLACHLETPAERSVAACVSLAWRAAVRAAPRIPRVLALGAGDDALTGSVLHSAGALVALDLSAFGHCSLPVLFAVLREHSNTLRELSLPPGVAAVSTGHAATVRWRGFLLDVGQALLAAPNLLSLHAASLLCSWRDAVAVACCEPPYGPLAVRELHVCCDYDGELGDGERFFWIATVLSDATLHPSLQLLALRNADLGGQHLEPVADAVSERPLVGLELRWCSAPAPVPLARLLRGQALTELRVMFTRNHAAALDEAGAALVAAALRSTRSLTSLMLRGAGLAHGDAAAVACTLLAALTGHASLRSLELSHEYGDSIFEPRLRSVGARRALGAALGALVAADAPALQSLNCSCNFMLDDGMEPLARALAGHHHLHELDITLSRLSEAFARDVLLPALQANTSLCHLACNHGQLEGEGGAFAACEQYVIEAAAAAGVPDAAQGS